MYLKINEPNIYNIVELINDENILNKFKSLIEINKDIYIIDDNKIRLKLNQDIYCYFNTAKVITKSNEITLSTNEGILLSTETNEINLFIKNRDLFLEDVFNDMRDYAEIMIKDFSERIKESFKNSIKNIVFIS